MKKTRSGPMHPTFRSQQVAAAGAAVVMVVVAVVMVMVDHHVAVAAMVHLEAIIWVVWPLLLLRGGRS